MYSKYFLIYKHIETIVYFGFLLISESSIVHKKEKNVQSFVLVFYLSTPFSLFVCVCIYFLIQRTNAP